MRTGREVRDKLTARGFDRGTVSTVVERLTEVGLINDAEYAAAFLRTSLKLRPRSYRVLLSELVKKGVSRETAGRAIAGSVELTPEVEAARRVMAKASRTYGRLPDGERRRKLFSFLARRGFSMDTISELLGEGNG
jgi:regulatory protein